MEMKIRKLEVTKHLQVATLPKKEDINDELQNKKILKNEDLHALEYN